MQRCPGCCCHLLVWKLTCFESRIVGLNLQGMRDIKNLLAYFETGSWQNELRQSWVHWNLCHLTLLIFCSECVSGRPAAQGGVYTAPTPASYADYKPPAHRKNTISEYKYCNNQNAITVMFFLKCTTLRSPDLICIRGWDRVQDELDHHR